VQKEEDGTLVSRVMVRNDAVLGYASLNAITSAPLYGASLGYWVDAAEYGRGIATSAVGALLRIADEDLSLHRIEAGTSPSNLASQRVLTKNGFEQFGIARSHLCRQQRFVTSHVAGRRRRVPLEWEWVERLLYFAAVRGDSNWNRPRGGRSQLSTGVERGILLGHGSVGVASTNFNRRLDRSRWHMAWRECPNESRRSRAHRTVLQRG